MLTYTNLRSLFGSFANNTSTTVLANGDTLMNEKVRQLNRSFDFGHLYTSGTLATIASTQFAQIPNNIAKLSSVYVQVGSTKYVAKEAPTTDFWNQLNTSNVTSNIPEWYIPQGLRLGLWPIPSGSANTLSFEGKRKIKDLSIADYTTGSIFTLTSGSTAIVGSSGTVWNTGMKGRFIRVSEADAASTGDGYWYEIASVTSGTALVLTKPYQGDSMASAAISYTIGQVPDVPEEYQMLPAYYAAEVYWAKNGNAERSAYYQGKYNELYSELLQNNSFTTNPAMENVDVPMQNPNNFIQL